MSATKTTAERNKAALAEALDRIWMEGDLSFVDERFADDYVLHNPARPQGFHGPEGFKEYVGMLRSAFPDMAISCEGTVADGDTLATRYRWRATHEGELLGIEPTGKEVVMSGMAFLRFEDGMRKEDWFLDDFMGLFAQLGVVEPPTA
ncbi:ester cyclase [Halobium salinum]|uniref:Ester cyclase n=1 Tax=Halobium salinum TaxID=1364940 RepID=A0ABD5PBZ7_9EURY|nr:ester cyclase [Halobium salinum]